MGTDDDGDGDDEWRCDVRERIRMIVAHLWDWLFRRSCWAESCAWALGTEGCRLRREAEGRGTRSYCPDGVRVQPGCWCGKFRFEDEGRAG